MSQVKHEQALTAARDALELLCGIYIHLPSEGDLDDLERSQFEGLEAAVLAYNDVMGYPALSSDAGDGGETLGKFGHHPDPATDFEIEVEAIKGYYFDATHDIGKPGQPSRQVDDRFNDELDELVERIRRYGQKEAA